MPHLQDLSGAVTKNLFLKDKKKKGLWLVSVRHDRPVNLNDLAKKLGLGSGNLRFAEEAAMLEKLKVGQGCATALALFCDKDQSVKVVLDSDLVNGGHERVYFHPMTNAGSMGLKPEDRSLEVFKGDRTWASSSELWLVNTLKLIYLLSCQAVLWLGTMIYLKVIYLCACTSGYQEMSIIVKKNKK